MSVHKLKDGRWIVKFPDPEKPSGSKREYFGRGAAAELAARSRDKELGLKRTKPRQDDESGPTFKDLSLEYLLAKNFQGDSARSVETKLKAVINPAIGDIPAIRLTHDDLSRYVRKRLQSVKATTVCRDLAMIQAVMNWSVKRRPPLIPINPLRGFSPPEADDAIISPPTSAEISEILKHAHERLRRFIIISWYTGARPGSVEVLSLEWGAVSWENKTIRIISAKKGGVRSRDVPIHPDFFEELKAWKEADVKRGYVGYIIHCARKRIQRIDGAWKITKKRAGIQRRIRLYDLRHFFVTSAIEAGCDYKTLSDVVGSNPETLRRHYQHVSNAARVDLIERMPSLNLP
jgi:integrase